MAYRSGDFWRIDDNSGFKVRASATSHQWDGLITTDPDIRNPQDFVRGRKDRQIVPDPRPEGVDNIIGPLTTVTTAAASAGANTITVELTTRMTDNDNIGIMLSSGNVHRAVIQSVSSATTLLLTAALPSSVDSGALVVDYSAVSVADYGQ